MAGIAGIDRADRRDLVARMLGKMAYRGRGDSKRVEGNSATEELMYYRIFREHFGDVCDLSWMGRTKEAPKT